MRARRVGGHIELYCAKCEALKEKIRKKQRMKNKEKQGRLL